MRMKVTCASVVLAFLLCRRGVSGYYQGDIKVFHEDESFARTSCQKSDRQEKKLLLLASGLSQLFWESVRQNSFDLPLSSRCREDLSALSDGIARASEEALRFLDSSSSIAASLLRGSLTNFGDYDQCLKASYQRLKGSFCSANIFYLDPDPLDTSHGVSIAYTGLDGAGLNQALCVPDSCSTTDIYRVLSNVTACYPVFLGNDLVCDTQDSVSLTSKLHKFAWYQTLALLAICSSIVLSFLVTFTDFLPDLTEYFCLRRNHESVFVPTVQSNKNEFVKVNKLTLIFIAVAGHIFSCIECPRFATRLSHTGRLVKFLRIPAVVYLLDEGNFTQVALFGGISAYERMNQTKHVQKRALARLLFRKWARYIPVFTILMLFELIWSLFGNGPTFIEVSGWGLARITNGWWAALLMLANYLPHFDPQGVTHGTMVITLAHLHYSMTEVQLFAIGAVAFYLLHKHPKVGFLFCLSACVAGYLLLWHFTMKYEVIPHILSNNLNAVNVTAYMTYVHFAIYTFVPTYICGILFSHLQVKYNLRIQNAFWMRVIWLVTFVVLKIAYFGPIAYHHYRLVSMEWTPLYIVALKASVTICHVGLYFMEDYQRPKLKETANMNSGGHQEGGKFDFLYGCSNLSFAVSICNYWLIRIEFFVQRDLFQTAIYPSLTRIVATYIIILMAAYLFQIFFLSPYEKLRKVWLDDAKLLGLPKED